MANVVYVASGLPPIQLGERKRSLRRVIKELAGAGGELREIEEPLRALEGEPSFRYVQAFTNVTKHRSLVGARPRVSFEPEMRQGLMINEFNYGGHTFEERWASELYMKARLDVIGAVVKAGNIVNRWLAGNAA